MSEAAYIDAESLQRKALERLSARGAPQWVVRALAQGVVEVRHAVSRWSASQGDVVGHAVTLTVDAGELSRLGADPVARESIEVALSGAASGRPLETITDVSLRWDGTVCAEAQGYRSAPGAKAPASLRDALAEWKRARGEGLGALGEVTLRKEHVEVRGERPEGREGAATERALLALSGSREVRWR